MRHVIITLMFFLVVFCAIFLVAILGLFRNFSLLPLGFSIPFENWVVIIFSIAGILKALHDIYILDAK